MLFSFKKNQETEEVKEEQVENISEEEQMKKLEKHFKKLRRKQKVKKYLLVFVLALGIFGGYKSLLYSESKNQYEDSENQTFVKTYAANYFSFPQDEEKYLEKYTLSKDWRNIYEKDIEYASLNDVEIYKVQAVNSDRNITRYYLYGTLISKKEEASEKNAVISFSIDVAKQKQRYLVVSPVEFTKVDVKAIQDEEQLKNYQYESEEGTDNVAEEDLTNLENTLNLFVKTYNEDVTQARLLVLNKSVLEKLDDNTKLTLLSISKATEDADNYYVEAKIQYSHAGVFSITKNVHFEVDKTKNKIKKMEDY